MAIKFYQLLLTVMEKKITVNRKRHYLIETLIKGHEKRVEKMMIVRK